MSTHTRTQVKPTVGRIVHFFPDTINVHAAIVTSVNEEGDAINLTSFDAWGTVQGRLNIHRRDPDHGQVTNVWDWPPQVTAP